ncbi:hypothetical protein [Actinocorallia longicatena]|uniref:Uncharacterized protein n=1 Tax=Actinocorallia longicatena TaxID=111803 RepID=A0ABP6QJS2_9ACTN
MNPGPLLPELLPDALDGMTTAADADVTALTAQIADLTARLEEARAVLARLEHTRQAQEEISARHPVGARDPLGYAEILDLLTRTPDGIRPKEVCRARGLPEEHKTIEGIRAKLKRLAGRDLAHEPQPGLFVPNKVTDLQKTL